MRLPACRVLLDDNTSITSVIIIIIIIFIFIVIITIIIIITSITIIIIIIIIIIITIASISSLTLSSLLGNGGWSPSLNVLDDHNKVSAYKKILNNDTKSVFSESMQILHCIALHAESFMDHKNMFHTYILCRHQAISDYN